MATSVLEAERVAADRGSVRVLSGVSVTLCPGRVTGIIGPNGAGKSTLMGILAGLERPAEGAVRLDGTDLAVMKSAVRARRIAYLPQNGRAEWAVTVRELVALGRLPYGVRLSAADHRAIDQALVTVDIEALGERSVATLSGGERARALFARALAVEATYLLADEPTLSLDPRHQLVLMETIRSLARQGRGVALVLHDLTLAARFCDHVLLLRGGLAVADLAPEEALNPERLAAIYGVAAVSGRHEGECFVIPWRPVVDHPTSERL